MSGKIVRGILGLALACIVFAGRGYAFDEGFTVVIDPGHGGKDSGAISASGLFEKHIVLDIARRMQAILREWNVNVIMTRTSDDFLSLSTRAHFINSQKPDVCVSIHANSSNIASVHGFESYIYDKRKRGTILHRIPEVNPSIFVFPMKYSTSGKHSKSFQAAYYMHTALAAATGSSDRGIRAAHFHLLRAVEVPCVLMEIGFMSNRLEAKRLEDSNYRQVMAQALAEGIMRAMNGVEADTLISRSKGSEPVGSSLLLPAAAIKGAR
ncbi:MAG: N-acetylmuramoyl-L-alanine amidase [Candidatus Auribacterota bacterium]